MPIQPSFERDIGNIFPQALAKSGPSPATLMDFVFKEYIQQDAPAKSSPLPEKGSEPPQEIQAGEEEFGETEEEILMPSFSLLPEILLPEEPLTFTREFTLTMKQLDQVLVQDLPEEGEADLPLEDLSSETPFAPPLPGEEKPLQKEVAAPEELSFSPFAEEEKKEIFIRKERVSLEKTALSQDENVTPKAGLSQETPFLGKGKEESTFFTARSFAGDDAFDALSASPSLTFESFPSSDTAATVPSAKITTQVLEQLPRELFLVQGNHQVTIQLYPEELGEVTVELRIGDKRQIQAVFSAALLGTLDLLRQDSSQLLQALKAEGFDVAAENFQFTSHQENAQEQPFRTSPFSQEQPPSQEMPLSSERHALALKRLENNLIDIRVS